MSEPTQLTREDVEALFKAKKYGEIEAARLDGRLATLLGQTPASPVDRQWTAEDVRTATRERRFDDIDAARRNGLLDDLLSGNTTDAA